MNRNVTLDHKTSHKCLCCHFVLSHLMHPLMLNKSVNSSFFMLLTLKLLKSILFIMLLSGSWIYSILLTTLITPTAVLLLPHICKYNVGPLFCFTNSQVHWLHEYTHMMLKVCLMRIVFCPWHRSLRLSAHMMLLSASTSICWLPTSSLC